jgi:hypothetical protein
MKESKLYFKFFKENLYYFIASSILFSLAGFFYQLHSPTHYQESRFLEIGQDNLSVSDRTSLVNEAVTFARSENVRKQNNMSSDIAVYNNSPLSVMVSSTSDSRFQSIEDLNKITVLLKEKFKFFVVGQDTDVKNPPSVLRGILVGFLAGNFLMTIFLLIKSYLKDY